MPPPPNPPSRWSWRYLEFYRIVPDPNVVTRQGFFGEDEMFPNPLQASLQGFLEPGTPEIGDAGNDPETNHTFDCRTNVAVVGTWGHGTRSSLWSRNPFLKAPRTRNRN